jgi:hypothetical protein
MAMTTLLLAFLFQATSVAAETPAAADKGDGNSAIVAAVIAAVAALISAWFSYRAPIRAAQVQAKINAEQVVAKFREPLVHAAYNLQSRLYRIAASDIVDRLLVHGDPHERQYFEQNTLFVLGQYFAWTEIIRREIQFLDLGEVEKTRKLAELQDSIFDLWQTEGNGCGKAFRIFAGEQRAIGERMIRKTSRGLECIGYGAFSDRLAAGQFPEIARLTRDVTDLATNLPAAKPRLVLVQRALIDLLDFLDPECIRAPRHSRSKI